MKRAVMCLVLLLWALPAHAQDRSVVAFSIGATADWITTYRNLHTGHGYEDTPWLKPLVNHPKTLILTGVAIDVVGSVAWSKITRNHPKLRRLGFYTAAAFRVGLAINNTRRHR